ncbi:hypothetical protein Goklo_005064, partial [Gossypium klotzschianum]|nr:hypothetical protein [Gossypium klotzschianum]
MVRPVHGTIDKAFGEMNNGLIPDSAPNVLLFMQAVSGVSFKCSSEEEGIGKGRRRNLDVGISGMAGERALFKFLKFGQRLQLTDVQATIMWGIVVTTDALWLI